MRGGELGWFDIEARGGGESTAGADGEPICVRAWCAADLTGTAEGTGGVGAT